MVTIKDIAEETGVRYFSGSVALGNRETKLPLAEKPRAKVLEAAQKLGDRRNALAEQVRIGRSQSLAFANALAISVEERISPKC